jgi:hypothetical protein
LKVHELIDQRRVRAAWWRKRSLVTAAEARHYHENQNRIRALVLGVDEEPIPTATSARSATLVVWSRLSQRW